MRPPCISMIRREMANPSPVPPFFLVIELSACWNSWKSLAWSAVEIPGAAPRIEARQMNFPGNRHDILGRPDVR